MAIDDIGPIIGGILQMSSARDGSVAPEVVGSGLDLAVPSPSGSGHLAVPGATGTIIGNIDQMHIGQLFGLPITDSEPTLFQLGFTGDEELAIRGTGLIYDAFDQLVGGTILFLAFVDPADRTQFGPIPQAVLHFSDGISAALPFLNWIVTDDSADAFAAVLAGDDTLTATNPGSAGALVRGFGGNDVLIADGRFNSLFGGAGDDTISGAGGLSSYLRGDDGNDSIIGGFGFDDINGNKGDDTIVDTRGGNDWLVGGQGNDSITGTVGQNILYGNLGNDTLHGGSGGDLLRGGQGDDVIVGGSGNDWISGDRGNDTITGGAGADIFHTFSGAGMDRVLDFHASEGDRVQVDAGTTWTVSQVGADTVIDMGNGDQMVLVGVNSATLPPGWIFVV